MGEGIDFGRIGQTQRARLLRCRACFDDSLDAFGVHGAGGTLGALLTGVFAAGRDTKARRG